MSPGKPFAVGLALAAAALACLPARAPAYFAPGAEIVSVSPEKREQADDASQQATISADGTYAVFLTRARNLFADDDPDPSGYFRAGGIFRRNLATGSLDLVAPGELRDEADPTVITYRGAVNPSVSADGRFVAFSTGWPLSAADTNGNVDVYVRDMNRPIGDSRAFELVSALDHSAGPISWGAASPDRPGRNPGAELTAGVSISADGSRVLFRTRAASNAPSGGPASVAAGQLLVRDRASQRTTLVTRNRVSGNPAGGAIGESAISGSGEAVAWVGNEAPSQTRFLDGEDTNPDWLYYLYRRLDDGGAGGTRRVTGVADLDDPGCDPSSSIVDDWVMPRTGPCYGPLGRPEWSQSSLGTQPPALSSDGWTVAYITDSPARPVPPLELSNDLFITSMRPGVSRKASTLELTRASLIPGAGDGLDGLAISGDGRWVAVSTTRRRFTWPALRQVGESRADGRARELYLVDTVDRTIERVVRSRLAGDADSSAGSRPSLSLDGRRILFVSEASNLIYGDANGVADVFLADRLDAPPAQDEAPPGPDGQVDDPGSSPGTGEAGPRSLGVTARKAAAGSVALRVIAPARGTLEAAVRGRLPNSRGVPSGKPLLLASRSKRIRSKGALTLTVPLNRSYRSALRAAGKITGQATVELTGLDGTIYRRVVTVQFRR